MVLLRMQDDIGWLRKGGQDIPFLSRTVQVVFLNLGGGLDIS